MKAAEPSALPWRRAIFLDRDGTLNEEKEYLSDPAQLVLLPDVAAALRRGRDAGFLLVVVTNQSGVARGYFTMAAVDALHHHLQAVLQAQGVRIDAFYSCPHHPAYNASPCDCRKGAPGMLLQAARDFRIDLTASWMIGDKLSDLQAGESAGCRAILVRSGYGAREEKKAAKGTLCADSLSAAMELILQHS